MYLNADLQVWVINEERLVGAGAEGSKGNTHSCFDVINCATNQSPSPGTFPAIYPK